MINRSMFDKEWGNEFRKTKDLEITILNRVTKEQKIDIQKKTGLDDNVFTLDKPSEERCYKVKLGEGSFSLARLAAIEVNGVIEYFAVRKIKSEDALRSHTNGKPPSPLHRGEVLEMTQKELYILNQVRKVVGDNVGIPIDVIEKKNKKGDKQIYQIMRLANLGNGNRIRQLVDLLHRKVEEDKVYLQVYQNIALTLLTVIGKLNDNGIYVNDIKPENILFDRSGHFWLSDFGSAFYFYQENNELKIIQASKYSDTKYRHPQMKNPLLPKSINKPILGRLNDKWALGLTLLEFLSSETSHIAAMLRNPIVMLNDNLNPSEAFTNRMTERRKHIMYLENECKEFIALPDYLKNIILGLLNTEVENSLSISELLNKYPAPTNLEMDEGKIQGFFKSLIENEEIILAKENGTGIINKSISDYDNDPYLNEEENQTPTLFNEGKKEVLGKNIIEVEDSNSDYESSNDESKAHGNSSKNTLHRSKEITKSSTIERTSLFQDKAKDALRNTSIEFEGSTAPNDKATDHGQSKKPGNKFSD